MSVPRAKRFAGSPRRNAQNGGAINESHSTRNSFGFAPRRAVDLPVGVPGVLVFLYHAAEVVCRNFTASNSPRGSISHQSQRSSGSRGQSFSDAPFGHWRRVLIPRGHGFTSHRFGQVSGPEVGKASWDGRSLLCVLRTKDTPGRLSCAEAFSGYYSVANKQMGCGG